MAGVPAPAHRNPSGSIGSGRRGGDDPRHQLGLPLVPLCPWPRPRRPAPAGGAGRVGGRAGGRADPMPDVRASQGVGAVSRHATITHRARRSVFSTSVTDLAHRFPARSADSIVWPAGRHSAAPVGPTLQRILRVMHCDDEYETGFRDGHCRPRPHWRGYQPDVSHSDVSGTVGGSVASSEGSV